MSDKEEKDKGPLQPDLEDSWWYRIYAAALIFTALFIVALRLFEKTFSK